MKIISLLIISCFFTVNAFSQACENSITASIPYLSGYASGSYTVSANNTTTANLPTGTTADLTDLENPIIIVEGFDYHNEFDCGRIYNIMNAFVPSGTLSTGRSVPSRRLAATLRAQGFDLVILNLDNGGDYIQRNAFLLIELIKQINSNKKISNEDLIVVGYSMGGLISRYALTYMEENNIDHQTRLFISYDSPQKGANQAMGIQSLLMGFRSKLGQLAPYVAEVERRYRELTCPAAKQMLIYHDQGISGNPGNMNKLSDHINFFNELNGLNDCNGYPKECRNVAITLGSGDGMIQQTASNNDVLPGGYAYSFSWEWNIAPFVGLAQNGFATSMPSDNWPNCPDNYPNQMYLSDLSGLTVDHMTINSSSADPLDAVPGSFTNLYEQVDNGLAATLNIGNFQSTLTIENATMIPTISALDLSTEDYFYNVNADPNILSITPFEEIFHSFHDNTSHLTPARNRDEVQFILNQVNDFSPSTCHTLNTSKTLNNRVVNNDEVFEQNYVGAITVNNFTVNSGGEVNFEATNSIEISSSFEAKLGSEVNIETRLVSKPCFLKYNF